MKQLICRIFGHRFGEWQSVPGVTCDQVRECTRCGVKVSRTVPHKFIEWQYDSDRSCHQTRTCQQCGKKEERDHHAWITDDDNPDYCYRRRCSRCGKIEERLHEQDYTGETEEVLKKEYEGEVEWNYVAQCSNYLCRHCGKAERRVSGYSHWVEAKKR